MYRFAVTAFLSLLSGVPLVHAQVGAAGLESPDRAVEINAERWFNAQPVRLYAEPEVILLYFWSIRSPESRALIDPLNRLYTTYRDGRLRIVALTDDRADDVERFVRREELKYKVGAESRSARAYGVREVPTVLLIDAKEKRIRWRGTGAQLDARSLRAAVEELLGSPDAVSRSERRRAEEKADISLYYARIDEAEAQVGVIVGDILASKPEGALIDPEDLVSLDAFYEANLPADPDQPTAPSENRARSLAIGTGYGALYASNRLSEAAKAAVRDRLLSTAKHDPGCNLEAIEVLRRVGEVGDEILLAELRSLRDAEEDPFVRGALEEALDRLNPAVPDSVKRSRRGNAIPLRNKVRKVEDPASTPWAQGYAYTQGVAQRSTRDLIADYWNHVGGDTDVERENGLLIRLGAITELESRCPGPGEDRTHIRSNMLDMLGKEPDLGIRWSIAGGLHDLGTGADDSERDLILEALDKHLATEPDKYFVRPRIEHALSELRAKH